MKYLHVVLNEKSDCICVVNQAVYYMFFNHDSLSWIQNGQLDNLVKQ